MTVEETAAFQMLDRYSRETYRCFVAEMFRKHDTVYELCFRPLDVRRDSVDRFLCEYVQLRSEDILLMGVESKLPDSVRSTLDSKLVSLQRHER